MKNPLQKMAFPCAEVPISLTRPALIAVSFYCAHFQGIFERFGNKSNVTSMFNIRRYAPKSRTNKFVEHITVM